MPVQDCFRFVRRRFPYRRIRQALLPALLLPLIAGLIGAPPVPRATATDDNRAPPQVAAFVRDGDLWAAEGGRERLLVRHGGVRTPRWSPDGRWIAYATRGPDHQIWARHAASGRSAKLCSGCTAFAWAHRRSAVAYNVGGTLYAVELGDDGSVGAATTVRADVGQFAWMPDDGGLIVGSIPAASGNAWQPLRLSLAHVGEDGSVRERPFFVLPGKSDELFAAALGPFRWSPDGRWIAFLAKPTASLSMDGNALCLLSADGGRFLNVGRMLARDDWYAWAPERNRIGWIEGEGRFEISGKRFEVRDAFAPTALPLTPTGEMDLDFAWVGDGRAIVARALELAWDGGSVPTAASTSLYAVDVGDPLRVERLTTAPEGAADRDPVYVAALRRIAWVRTDHEREQSDAWTAKLDGSDAAVAIKRVDEPPAWYDPAPTTVLASPIVAPGHAEWGRLAMKEVAYRYKADIVDYAYLGKTTISPSVAEQTFRMRLKEERREFGVVVSIRYREESNEVLRIDVQET